MPNNMTEEHIKDSIIILASLIILWIVIISGAGLSIQWAGMA